MSAPGPVELRRGVLAVSVLHDVDVDPTPLGVALPGSPTVWVSWGECRRALAGTDPESDLGRARLLWWLQARRWSADLPREVLAAQVVPAGLPVDHVLHPGLDWVCERVRGDALDLGLAAVGLDPDDPDRAVLLPGTVLPAAGLDPSVLWLGARERLEALGAVAADRVSSDARGVLRPCGPCDVVTLLGSTGLRRALAAASGGLGAAVVPMRRRGWTRLAVVDPAFGPAAAAATDPVDRGFDRPLLVTADELTLAREASTGRTLALQGTAVDAPWVRDVLYR